MDELVISNLGHTWIIDLDGTIVKHNGYKIDGYDTILNGVKEFLNQIPDNDLIIFLTSRTDEYRNSTMRFLKSHNIKFDHIIFNAPYGERILINDNKPSGLITGIVLNRNRDEKWNVAIKINTDL